jgi:hypothetical protein
LGADISIGLGTVWSADKMNEQKQLEIAIDALKGIEWANDTEQQKRRAVQALADMDALKEALCVEKAHKFHEAYERLAPQFGYETRSDTKVFEPDSPNGRLMIAVMKELNA